MAEVNEGYRTCALSGDRNPIWLGENKQRLKMLKKIWEEKKGKNNKNEEKDVSLVWCTDCDSAVRHGF